MTRSRLLSAASLLGLSLAGFPLAAPALADDTRTLWRVFIGDHAAPRITAFDLDAPDTRWTFDTAGQAKLHSVAGGRGVVAVQSDADRVHVLHSGVDIASHGDHSDLAVTEPTALAQPLTGPRPFHVVGHDGMTVVNYDKGGYAEIIPDAALEKGDLTTTRFPQSRAHHGFVAAFGDVMLSSVASDAPTEGDAAPARLGLQAFDAEGKPVGDLATCTGIHGEAFSGAYLAAGCKEGVITVREGADGPEFRMLPYPADLPQGDTTGTLLGASAMQIFLGNHGEDGLVVIDPEEAPHFRHVALPFRRVDFALDPARPQHAYVLTEDGTLHRLDLLAAEIEASARATGPYSMDGHWNDARPRLAVAGDRILVTDPAEQALRVIATDTLTEERSIPVEGRPYNIVAIGGTGMEH